VMALSAGISSCGYLSRQDDSMHTLSAMNKDVFIFLIILLSFVV